MLARYRAYVTPLALIAAAVLVYLVNPWYPPSPNSTARDVGTVVFWVLALVVLVLLFADRGAPSGEVIEVEGPALTRYLFSNTSAGLLWLPIRIFLGFEFAVAGWHKLTSATGWTNGGASLLAYWQSAVKVPAKGSAPITFDWYRSFLQFLIDHNAQGLFGWLIALGETAVGIGLLVGALVGIAAFFGVVMNMSYLLAGSTSVNPVMFALAIGLILGWRVAGYYGVDRWLLPRLGVPWHARVLEVPLTSRSPAAS
jgi:thiosulfate dehydrogenase [quinone] large subunit